MIQDNATFSSARRRLLKLLGLGVVGTALGTVVASDKVFAKQFLGKGPEVNIPDMVYDPDLQMMVDPLTREPIYKDAKKIYLATPVVTAGCSDCPKKDDCTDDMCK